MWSYNVRDLVCSVGILWSYNVGDSFRFNHKLGLLW